MRKKTILSNLYKKNSRIILSMIIFSSLILPLNYFDKVAFGQFNTINISAICHTGNPDPSFDTSDPVVLNGILQRITPLTPAADPNWPAFGFRGFFIHDENFVLGTPLIRVFNGAFQLDSDSFFVDSNGLEAFIANNIPPGMDEDNDGIPDDCYDIIVESKSIDDATPPFFRGAPNSFFAVFSDDFLADREGSGCQELAGNGQTLLDSGSFPAGFPLSPIIPDFVEIESGFDFIVRFEIPNFIDDLNSKTLRVQVSYCGPQGSVQIMKVEGLDSQTGTVQGTLIEHVDETAFTTDSVYFYEDWEINPNPDSELIDIFLPFGSTLVEVVIDTISIDKICSVPDSGDWTITSSCTLDASATAAANVIVESGSELTVESGVTFIITSGNNLLVKSGGIVQIETGGTIIVAG